MLNGRHPTLEHFTALTGISVNYTEPVSDNLAFYDSIRPSLERKQYTGYDIIVTTTNSPALAELINNGWLIPLDQTMMTNFRSVRAAGWPRTRLGSRQHLHDGLAVGLDRDRLQRQAIVTNPGTASASCSTASTPARSA